MAGEAAAARGREEARELVEQLQSAAGEAETLRSTLAVSCMLMTRT